MAASACAQERVLQHNILDVMQKPLCSIALNQVFDGPSCGLWQAWRAVHPPKRGRWGMRPLVHVGFLKSWSRGGLDIRVTSRIREIIQGPDFDPTKALICVTGGTDSTETVPCPLNYAPHEPSALQSGCEPGSIPRDAAWIEESSSH